MAYTYNDAIKTTYDYLGITEDSVDIIPETNKRGFIYKNKNNENCVIFVCPIGCKQDNKQNWIDTRDSGVNERKITYNYAKNNNLKYFCLCVNSEQERYKDYFFSLENSEEKISEISFRTKEGKEGTGTQANIPNDCVPLNSFSRIKTDKGFYFAIINKQDIQKYLIYFDNRPYNNESTENDDTITRENQILKYWQTEIFNLDEVDSIYKEFNEKFGKEAISKMTDNECLNKLFGNASDDSLTYNLEKNPEYYKRFGRIKVRSKIAFTLYRETNTNTWNYGTYHGNTHQISNQEATKIAVEYRDMFLKLFSTIEEFKNNNDLNDENCWLTLEKQIKEGLGKLKNQSWVYKYLHFIFPDIFVTFFSAKWAQKVFTALNVEPKPTYILQCLQFSKFARKIDIKNVFLYQILIEHFISESEDTENEDLTDSENKNEGCNIIYYGIPGCGKSYYVEHNLLGNVKEENKFRTTFYLDYSNTDFVGQIYPTVLKNNGETKVTYEMNPGPFTKALARAYDSDEQIYLVIEEINRGNAAAIFGDLFQLLDRLQEASNKDDDRVAGDSEYPINNEFIERYLADHNIAIPALGNKIYIPHNLTIYATMNTSDQNVFPLDTAFKRRWQRERVVTDWKDVDERKNMYVPGMRDITWMEFVDTINKEIVSTKEEDEAMSEDKQIGAFFVTKDMLCVADEKFILNENEPVTEEQEIKLKRFVNNVIDYLFNDVTKFKHDKLFKKELHSYDDTYKNIIDFHDASYGLKNFLTIDKNDGD